jgi:hypothetical protein
LNQFPVVFLQVFLHHQRHRDKKIAPGEAPNDAWFCDITINIKTIGHVMITGKLLHYGWFRGQAQSRIFQLFLCAIVQFGQEYTYSQKTMI